MDLAQGSVVCLAMIKDGLEGINFTYVRFMDHACVCNGCPCVCVCTTVYTGNWKAIIGVSVSSRYTQIIRLGRKYLWQLSHLANPEEIL